FRLGAQTLGGTGQIAMSGPNARIILGFGGAGTLTVASGVTIHGQGSIGDSSPGTLINQGTLTADVSGQTLTVNPGTVTNQGTLRATSGGTLSVANLMGALTGTLDLTGAG